jgi:hypothetical protein
MVKISLLRPVLASIELARNASIARRQGLKPAKRPAAKTVAADNMVRSLRAFSEAHTGEVITVICELSPAKAGEKIMTNVMQIHCSNSEARQNKHEGCRTGTPSHLGK